MTAFATSEMSTQKATETERPAIAQRLIARQATESRADSNPFSTRWIRPGAIPFQFPPDCGAAELVERFAQLSWRAAIRGPHGSGKSTLLATLAPELERRGRRPTTFALHDGQGRLPSELLAMFPTDPQSVIVVDGYEQLCWFNRWRLDRLCRRSGCGLLVTAHGATRLAELFRTTTDVVLAQRVVLHLLRNDHDSLDPADVDLAFAANGGNLRETLFSLYDRVEQLRDRSVVSRSALPRG